MAKSKFTAEIRRQALDRFEFGCNNADTASAIGVTEGTLKGWLTRGRRAKDGPYADFARDVEAARDLARSRRPMDRDELIRVVSEAARRGNTQAMKLRWEIIRHDETPAEVESPKVGSLDELAERRLRAA